MVTRQLLTTGAAMLGLFIGLTIPPADASDVCEASSVLREIHIHFEYDRYDVTTEAETLKASARWLAGHPDYLVLLEGHTDERRTHSYALALAERRARSVMRYLTSNGVAQHRITIVAYGKEHPVCAEHTEECWARNRRVVLRIKVAP